MKTLERRLELTAVGQSCRRWCFKVERLGVLNRTTERQTGLPENRKINIRLKSIDAIKSDIQMFEVKQMVDNVE